MDTWQKCYPDVCNCQGGSHKFLKNCTSCGLIYCQLNEKLSDCTYCSHSFNQKDMSDKSSLLPNSSLKSSLEKALKLQSSLLEADLDKTRTTVVDNLEERSSNDYGFVQTLFCSASDIAARRQEIESFKDKLEKEREQKLAYDLSKMIGL